VRQTGSPAVKMGTEEVEERSSTEESRFDLACMCIGSLGMNETLYKLRLGY
jgi:hypothetical protein